ncbi:hypothetical protein ACE1TI_06945 [Alteribacillus sp. JSM 102045]|uniref:hypothetical protein n=1 Tax=Alteribacillus sp. JSM 102045 TaxID=1562101 RepID=UPI0035C2462C
MLKQASFAEQSSTTFQLSQGRISIILTPPERFISLSEEDTLEIVLQDLHAIPLPFAKEDIV